MNAAQLNEVANYLTAQGIKVTKEMVFSVCIQTLVEAGLSVREATDAVLGEGRYDMIEQGVLSRLY